MDISIDGTIYNLPERYGGTFLPIVSHLDKPLKKVATLQGPVTVGTDERSEYLKDFLLFRVQALSFSTYKEHSWEDIRRVSEEVMGPDDFPSFNYTPDPSLSTMEKWNGIEDAQKASRKERALFRKKILKEAELFLPTALKTITFQGLDWLNYFHEVTSQLDIDIFETIELKPILRKILIDLRKRYPVSELKYYHLIPEIIDWNFYLSIRGSVPRDFRWTKYSLTLDFCYKLEKTRRDREKIYSFFKDNPEELNKVLDYGYSDHPKAPRPRDVEPQRLYRFAKEYYHDMQPKKVLLSAETRQLFDRAYRLSKEKGIPEEEALKLVSPTK